MSPQQPIPADTVPVSLDVLALLQALAEKQNRSLQSLVQEVLSEFLQNNVVKPQPQSAFIAACQASHAQFAPLYRKLAQ
jgi:hypothetical protein